MKKKEKAEKNDKKLIIVESPAKVHTISKFLGKDYSVTASMGHIIDLPKSMLGIDVENNFKPKYIVMRAKSKTLKEIKEKAKKCSTIYLAADPDREGEAISWHIGNVLKEGREIKRIVFNEITQKAVLKAIENPREIMMNLVDAQQARRVLDRLVGYKISPLLWANVQGGLSAGRVQSVALRMICEREAEIEKFKPQEYWSIMAALLGKLPPEFDSKLIEYKEKKVSIENSEQAENIVADLKSAEYIVKKIEKKEKKKNPVPPFITSTLQQEASKKLGFMAKKTMMIAQQLYEGINIGNEGEVGLITYMRTDSLRISDDSLAELREFIKTKYGAESLPESPNIFKNKKSAQDAHEAIRPTSVLREPQTIKEFLSKDQFRLYELIWRRYAASQMLYAVLEVTSIDIAAGDYTFRTSGTTVKSQGFLAVYGVEPEEDKENKEEKDEKEEKEEKEQLIKLPVLEIGEKLSLIKLSPEQHFTQPPPRYNDASLVKALEENNIGRPSTYAPIISTILGRNYVERIERKFKPTELGILVNDVLMKSFSNILNIEFTANMEEELDKIEEGTVKWQEVIDAFYKPFSVDLEKASSIMGDIKKDINGQTNEVCEKCGKPMSIKWGARGKFLACSGFPECRFTKSMDGSSDEPEISTEVCAKCGSKMIVKFSRFGRFLACEKYPECKTTKSIGIGIKCPKKDCGGDVIFRTSKRGTFYGCSNYPNCDFISRTKPVVRQCLKCGYALMTQLKDKFRCLNSECKHEEPASTE
jgi:DNA topoisomerase-1